MIDEVEREVVEDVRRVAEAGEQYDRQTAATPVEDLERHTVAHVDDAHVAPHPLYPSPASS